MEGNALAFLVLFSWPVVVMFLFLRLSIPRALAISIIGGYLFLPEQTALDFPILPALDKALVPSIAAFLMCVIISARNKRILKQAAQTGRPVPENVKASAQYQTLRGWLPRSVLATSLVLVFIFVPFLTSMENKDTLIYGPIEIYGLTLYDTLAAVQKAAITLFPFLLARKFLADAESHVVFLQVMCVAALVYSIPILFEVRMSPQLNRMIYGFFPHSFFQHMRQGGFRPIVFLNHGLWVGIFMACGVIAAVGLTRIGTLANRGRMLAVSGYLFLVLILSKNLGAFALTLMAAPMVFFLGRRIQLRFAVVCAVAVLLYPTLRSNDMVPVDRMLEVAAKVDEDRARSLQFRLDSEDVLMQKINERPLYGWGGYGRDRLYDEFTGRLTTVADGRWVIRTGQHGFVGFISEFGLLTIPVFLIFWRRRTIGITVPTTALAIMLAVNLIDLIPNATLTPLTWLMVGALMGRSEIREDVAHIAERSLAEQMKFQRNATGTTPETMTADAVTAGTKKDSILASGMRLTRAKNAHKRGDVTATERTAKRRSRPVTRILGKTSARKKQDTDTTPKPEPELTPQKRKIAIARGKGEEERIRKDRLRSRMIMFPEEVVKKQILADSKKNVIDETKTDRTREFEDPERKTKLGPVTRRTRKK
jgi:hypothetical protein